MYQATLDCGVYSFRPASDFQLFKNMSYMYFDGSFADVESYPNLFVALAGSQRMQHFRLAWSEFPIGNTISQLGPDCGWNPGSSTSHGTNALHQLCYLHILK